MSRGGILIRTVLDGVRTPILKVFDITFFLEYIYRQFCAGSPAAADLSLEGPQMATAISHKARARRWSGRARSTRGNSLECLRAESGTQPCGTRGCRTLGARAGDGSLPSSKRSDSFDSSDRSKYTSAELEWSSREATACPLAPGAATKNIF